MVLHLRRLHHNLPNLPIKYLASGKSTVKLIYMAIHEAAKRWTMPIYHWKQALNHFAILYEDRLPQWA